MLVEEDLVAIVEFVNAKSAKVLARLKEEKNQKIVNYSIRMFIEKLRDKLKRFEPVTLVDNNQTLINKATQLDRVELTIGQL